MKLKKGGISSHLIPNGKTPRNACMCRIALLLLNALKCEVSSNVEGENCGCRIEEEVEVKEAEN